MVRVGKAVKAHRAIMNSPLPTYSCEHCGKDGFSSEELRSHVEEVIVACDVCEMNRPLVKLMKDGGIYWCVACAIREGSR